MRTLRSGISRGTETLVFRGGVPASQYARDARAVPGGRLPRAGEVRLPQRRRRRAGPGRSCSGAPSSASTRTRPPTSSRPGRWSLVPDDVPPARAVLAGTVETAVNALWDAAPLRRRPGRRRRRRHGRLLRRAAARPASPASSVTLVDVDAGRAEVAAALGRRLRAARPTPPATATWSCTPARPPPGCSARSTCSPPRARSST